MKINWGTGIVIAFALFITFIMYFVYKVQSDSKYDNDLVVEDYYVHDMAFSDEMKRAENAIHLKEKPQIQYSQSAVIINFPESFNASEIKGNVALYRPSNKKFDFQSEIKLKDSQMIIENKKLIKGLWKVNMEWEYQGKKFLSQESIFVD
ncbi:FixH family protein [Flavobacterium agrisoli]|uniref:FixH family protein n=1 Tax=Flavobacterium agrisoli TaxID=2793066 RepID=A0A934PK91_9FLAO|nr:FixH family protein [Flavobacterium agrisoli]MBK0368468.1 FixH family protein [Flavobacterium agrisoli]